MSDEHLNPIETVVCAIDFSEPADLALEVAARFARRHEARLVIAHVVEPIPLGPYPVIEPPDQELEIEAWAKQRTQKVADDLATTGLSVEVVVEKGHPGSKLLEIADSVGADLIVLATRGLTGLKGLALGSTAEAVVRKSRCPVLTIHPEDEILSGSIEKVLLPTDLSLDAQHAAEAFVALFGSWERPEVTLLYADRTPPYLEPFRHDVLARSGERDLSKEKIEAEMAPVEALLRAADFEVVKVVLDGDPVSATADYAKANDTDLILLSTHGRSAFANVLFGRTAQRIVQHAPCPVLSVRTRPYPDDDD